MSVRSWWAGLVGAVFLFGMGGLQAGLMPVPAAAQAAVQQITDCGSEYGTGGTAIAPAQGSLSYAVAQGGTWAFACSGTGPFTIGITSTLDVPAGKTVALESADAAVSLSGGNSTELFTVEGSLTLDGLILENGVAMQGGAIDDNGTLTVSNCTFSGNSGYGNGYNNGYNNGNSAGYGGAIYNARTLTISNSTFSGNSANVNGGAIDNEGTAIISNSTFSGNGASNPDNPYGGAIYNSGALTVTNSTFTGNSAGMNGGAIDNAGTLSVSNSTFSGNSAGENGGAIDNAGTLSVSNSTFSGNSADPEFGMGGAIVNFSSTLEVANSTFSDNSAGLGGNLMGGGTLYNTIVASTTRGGNCLGTFSGNNDLEYGSTNCGGSGWATGNPNLGPLQDNGGPTQTMALGPGSAAIGAGDPTICASAPVDGFDQRGVARGTTMATCDIGAYQATAPSQADLAAQYVLQPSPIAPPGTLAPGQTVAATVYTETYTGAMAPDVPLYLSFTGGIGSAGVGGVALTPTPQLFTSDGAGRVVIQYTSGTTPIGGGTDAITVADAATNPTLQASDSYSYVTFASLDALAGQFETQPGIADALSAELGAAADAAARGNTQAMDGALSAFEHAVMAQAGKTITEAQAAILIGEAQQLEQ